MVATAKRPMTEQKKKQVVADWMKSPRAIGRRVWARITWTLFVVAFHSTRIPLYVVRLVLRAPWGGLFLSVMGLRWLVDASGAETVQINKETVAKTKRSVGSINTAEKRHDQRVRVRLGSLAVVAIIGYWQRGLLLDSRPVVLAGWVLVALCVVGAFGFEKRTGFMDTAASKRFAPPLTKALIAEALENCGIPELARAMREEESAHNLRVDVSALPDGRGVRVDVDVPVVTAAMVIEKSQRFIRGLRRNTSTVFLDADPTVDLGRLVVTVLDKPIGTYAGQAFVMPSEVDVFDGIDIGVSPRGERVKLDLMYQALLMGAAPGGGKSFTLRLLLLLCALDTRVSVALFDFGGKGEYSALRPICDDFRQGDDPEDIDAGMDYLRWLDGERKRRKKKLLDLAATDEGLRLVPDSKITPDLAALKDGGMRVLIVGLDEFQAISEHPDFAKEFDRLARDNFRQFRAVGIIPILSTQKPEASTISTMAKDQLTLRILFRVMSWESNDMVLGPGSHKAGYRATEFAPSDHGRAYVKTDGAPTLTQIDFLDGVGARDVVKEIVRRRTEAGVVKGNAAGETSAAGTEVDTDSGRVIDHVLEVWPQDQAHVPSVLVAALLAERWQKYETWSGADVTRSLSGLVKSKDRRFDGRTRKCLLLTELRAAAAA